MQHSDPILSNWWELLAPEIGSDDGLRSDESPEDCDRLAEAGTQPLLAALPSRGVLSLEGADATRFLQGQFSCDVSTVAVGESLPSACCTPKGRAVANPRLWRIDEQRWLLVLPREAIAALSEFLSRYLVFSRAELRDLSDELLACASFGAVDCTGLDALADVPDNSWGGAAEHGWWRRVAPQWRELWLPAERAAEQWSQLVANGAQPVGEAVWQLKLIRRGDGELRQRTSGVFLPQMLNLDARGGIDYDKGCYTGQEVVARTHFRGQLKRRMYRAELEASALPTPGTALHDPNGLSCGQVLCAAPVATGKWELLAVLRCEARATAQLDGAALRLLPLPYPLDED